MQCHIAAPIIDAFVHKKNKKGADTGFWKKLNQEFWKLVKSYGSDRKVAAWKRYLDLSALHFHPNTDISGSLAGRLILSHKIARSSRKSISVCWNTLRQRRKRSRRSRRSKRLGIWDFVCFRILLMEVFTLPHEFRWNPPDSNRNVGIPWNSDRIHLAGASAILVFHSIEFPTESNRIWRNQLESGSLREWFPLESAGMCWNPWEFQWIPTHSNGFQCLPLLLL